MTGTPPNSSPPPGAKPIWGSYGAGTAPAPSAQTGAQPAGPKPSRFAPKGFGGEPLDPLSRRLMYGVKVLAVLMGLVAVNSFVNSSGSDDAGGTVVGVAANAGAPANAAAPANAGNASGSDTGAPANANAHGEGQSNPVAAAVERTEDVAGARFSLYMVYSTPAFPQPLKASGSGIYNEKNDRSRFTFEMADPMSGAPMQMIQITDGDVDYEGGDLVREKLPPGKEWVRTEGSDGSGEDETPMSIDESMEILGTSGKIEMLGRESIHGRTTRHYRGEVSIGDLAGFLREQGKEVEAEAYERIEGLAATQVSAEGWIDGKDMLRRLRLVMPLPKEQGEPPVTLDMRMDFLDYGPQAEIQLPDPDTVVEGPLDEAVPPSGSVS